MDTTTTLRSAATQMRENPDPRWHPVGAWLDGLAWHIDEFDDDDTRDMADALTVARAYLELPG